MAAAHRHQQAGCLAAEPAPGAWRMPQGLSRAFLFLGLACSQAWAQPNATPLAAEPTAQPPAQQTVHIGPVDAPLPFKDVAFEAVASTIRSRQHNPLRAARALAALSVAQAQAVHGARASPPAAQHAAAQQAAAWALAWFFPQEAQEPWLAGLLPTLAQAEQSPAAMQAVAQVIERSLSDGADARRRPLTKPPWRPGVWQRTPPMLAEQPTEPQAPLWQPWCPGTEALQPPDPPPHGSAIWREHMAEVQRVGQSTTPEQKMAAQRWNLDAGSVTPPGVWNIVVREYLAQHPLPPAQHHRTLALLNMAMHDALVAAWRVKLTHWTERPYTAIRREIDPTFEPLVPTPPFPGYVSGHATVSGAAAGVLSVLLPAGQTRWQALAHEAAESRLWGGIHPRFDNDAGLRLGEQVAQICLRQFEPADAKAPVALIAAPANTSVYSAALPSMSVWRE